MRRLPRRPRQFNTDEQKQIWHDTCVGLRELGRHDVPPWLIERHVYYMVWMRDTIRNGGVISVADCVAAVDAVGRSLRRLYREAE